MEEFTMKEQSSNPCEKVSFILTYDQLEAAYNIYREQFISCDFIRRSLERLEERIGLCNLPYETLRDDPNLLHEAYLQFIRLEDCNVAYNDTLEQVINEIEQRLATGILSPTKLTVSSQNIGETFGTEVDA
jgi:heme oxygenase